MRAAGALAPHVGAARRRRAEHRGFGVPGRDEVWRASADDLVLVNAVAVADVAGTVVSASRDPQVRRWR